MAYFRKHGSGWQASIERRGVRRAQTFATKAAAVAWAGEEEAKILAGRRGDIPNLTVRALLERYAAEVSGEKKGARWERIRLKKIGRDRLGEMKLRQLDAPHVANWQQRRLAEVSPASVRRERNLLNNVFEIARKEWKWLRVNPFEGVRRPKDGKPRQRIASAAEVAKLTLAASPAFRSVIVFALETGMRAGEIAALRDVRGCVAYLHDSKTGHGREVPLSEKALEAWAGGFSFSAGSISALFARLCDELKIDGLTFHDLRHTAATRLSKKLDAWELCKMFGWKDPRIALNTYYKADPAETAKKLA